LRAIIDPARGDCTFTPLMKAEVYGEAIENAKRIVAPQT